MLDLTKLKLTKGPWRVLADDLGKLISSEQYKDNRDELCRIMWGSTKDSLVLAASYEMLSNIIEDTLALEPFDDGDQDNSVVRSITRNIEFLEKLLGLTWPEIKQRLGV